MRAKTHIGRDKDDKAEQTLRSTGPINLLVYLSFRVAWTVL